MQLIGKNHQLYKNVGNYISNYFIDNPKTKYNKNVYNLQYKDVVK